MAIARGYACISISIYLILHQMLEVNAVVGTLKVRNN